LADWRFFLIIAAALALLPAGICRAQSDQMTRDLDDHNAALVLTGNSWARLSAEVLAQKSELANLTQEWNDPAALKKRLTELNGKSSSATITRPK
jgi:hypothetical protein